MIDKKYKKIVKLSPVISSENLGDTIIDFYCDNILEELFPQHIGVCVPTREHFSMVGARHIESADYTFVCGTNLISGNQKKNQQWNLNWCDVMKVELSSCRKKDILKFNTFLKKKKQSPILLFGVGWYQYNDLPDSYTKKIYNRILSKKGLHSVRDSYTEQRLREMGINNVVNTACPTMWGLTTDFCKKIPKTKASKVITTLTNYHMDRAGDNQLLDILLNNYKEVYVWLQAIEDYNYLMQFDKRKKIHIIPPTLSDFKLALKDPDIEYIGTRLHGGIYALNSVRRTLIVATDNRALEIANDTGLPVITRSEISEKMERMILESRKTNIVLPENNIKKWKEQFG